MQEIVRETLNSNKGVFSVIHTKSRDMRGKIVEILKQG